MAQPTQLVYSDSPGAVPASYTVPPSLDLVLQSVVVRWNGTGAAGAFLPVLAVYSQDGKLVGRFHPGTQLEAGDTGVVTYAPFLRPPAAAAATAGVSHRQAGIYVGLNVTTVSGVVKTFTANAFCNDQGLAFDVLTVPNSIRINTSPNYYYTATFWARWPAFAADRYIEITSPAPLTDFLPMAAPARARGAATPDNDYQIVTTTLFPVFAGGFLTLSFNLFQASGVNQVLTDIGASVIAHLLVEEL